MGLEQYDGLLDSKTLEYTTTEHPDKSYNSLSSLASMNDLAGLNFNEIADIIEFAMNLQLANN